MIKHSYTEFFIAALYNAGCNDAQAQANNIPNTIHGIHESNIKLHELDEYSQHI